MLLWSPKGAGPSYHGPGMNAWRLYSRLDPACGAVSLMHANPEHQSTSADPWLESFCVAGSSSGPWGWPRAIAQAIAYMRNNKSKIDVVHGLLGYYPTVCIALAAESMGIPAVVKIAANGTEIRSKAGIQNFHRQFRYKAMREISAFIAISEEIADGLCALKIPTERIHLIPNGVDTDLFRPRQKVFHFTNNRKKILFSGALVRRKRPHLLISAIPYLRNQRDVDVLFAGPIHDEQYFKELKSLALTCGVSDRVLWTGFVNDMPNLLSSVDALCLPSSGEGMANAILEAMASGVPFVATPCSGMDELCRSGGGLIVEPDPRQIAAALNQLLSHQTAYGAKGREAALRRYSTKVVLHEHLKLFQSLKK